MSELPRQFGAYNLLKLLARGGMGEIYLARTAGISSFEKYYAVKRLLKKFTHDNDVGARFVDEARLGARLQHPNIVQVYDLGRVPSKIGRPNEATDYMGSCGEIAEGYYGCGSFGPGKFVALRAICRCVGGRLVKAEVCEESDKYNRCVRNQRRKGKKFYPFNNKSKVVCAKRKDVEKA